MAGGMERAPERGETVRVLAAAAGIYTAQSAIGGLSFQALPAVLRSAGAGLELVGLASLCMLPWALKFLWAPAVERFRQRPGGGRRSRPLILAGQGAAIALIAFLAGVTPQETPAALFITLGLAAVVAATTDIACDGFMVERLTGANRAWGGMFQVGGGYAGVMLGGGLFLVLVDRLGWTPAVWTLVGLLTLLTLPAWLAVEPPLTAPAARALTPPSLAAAFAAPDVRFGLAAVLIFQPGLRLVHGLAAPFLVDRGFNLELLGLLHGGAGTVASLGGALLAGLAARRWGAANLLRPTLLLEAGVFSALALAALRQAHIPAPALAGLLLALSTVTGAAFVVLYTAMLGWTSLRQPGVDFTVFQCADALVAAIAGYGGALLAARLGYEASFGLAAAAAVGAAASLSWLRSPRAVQPETIQPGAPG